MRPPLKVSGQCCATGFLVVLVACCSFSSEALADDRADAGAAPSDDGDVALSPEDKILRGISRLIEGGKYDSAGQAI
jgi:hypothetical protein